MGKRAASTISMHSLRTRSGRRALRRIDVAERVALENDAELNALFQRMLKDFSLSDEFYRSLNERMADICNASGI